jgi:hypothetical protein
MRLPIEKGLPQKPDFRIVKDQVNPYAKGGLVRPAKLVKGSAAAKKYMAALRQMRK